MPMARLRLVFATLFVVGGLGLVGPRDTVRAQAPRTDTGDAAVAALVAEVRALRADMAAASRDQLRAQLLLGRVQMQEQRLAYLDKQRQELATYAAMQAQMTTAMRGQYQDLSGEGCTKLPTADARRDCEAQTLMVRKQYEEQETRMQQLRAQERELESALSSGQARWSEFNSRLDELEQALR
jgi:uncharacterized membrane-anchored protein YhcB (DUF1043 family)